MRNPLPRTRARATVAALSVCVVAAAAATSGITTASATSHRTVKTPSSHTSRHTRAPARHLTAVPAEQQARFALFTQIKPSAMPGVLTKLFSEAISPKLGMAPSLAREVSLPTGTLWVVPGSGGMCIAAIQPGSTAPMGISCDYLAGADAHGVQISGGTQGSPIFLAGIVPDGISTVQITKADGSTVTDQVVDNAYALTLPQQPTAITMGGVTTPIGT
jgi:hypothetical protein